MKSRTLTSIISTILFAALAVPIRLAAQERQNKQQPHYKLIDLGTLGGPNSGIPTSSTKLMEQRVPAPSAIRGRSLVPRTPPRSIPFATSTTASTLVPSSGKTVC